MTNQTISIEKDMIKEKGGVVILNLEKYQELGKKIEEYEKKERTLRNLELFEKLARWGRSYAQKKKITPTQVLKND